MQEVEMKRGGGGGGEGDGKGEHTDDLQLSSCPEVFEACVLMNYMYRKGASCRISRSSISGHRMSRSYSGPDSRLWLSTSTCTRAARSSKPEEANASLS